MLDPSETRQDDTEPKPLSVTSEKLHLDPTVLQVCAVTAPSSSVGSPTNAESAMVDSSSSFHSETGIGESLDEISAVDLVLSRIEGFMRRLQRVQRSMIKRRAAEADLLTHVESARDLLERAIQGDKLQLNVIYGGQCIRIGKLRHMLDTVELSSMYASDQRWRHIHDRVESVEAILKELGTYKRWVPPVLSHDELLHATASQNLVPLLESSTGEVWTTVLTPIISGVWDGSHVSGIRIKQTDDVIEIFLDEEARGTFTYDREKGVFVGMFDGEEVNLWVENGELKFSNGLVWEHRPVDATGSWDRCVIGDDFCVRFVISQKGAQITAVTEDPTGEVNGSISGNVITLKCEEESSATESAEAVASGAVTGTFNDAKNTIVWSDDTTWLKRPKVDIEGIWDEVPGTGNASYFQGMKLSLIGPNLKCDHVTLSGKGNVDDVSGIAFHFDKRGEDTAQISSQVITWSDGTQWRKRDPNAIETDMMDDPCIQKWRRRHSFGPFRRSFYLDSACSEDAISLPDLFPVNATSTDDTQAAYNAAFENFSHMVTSLNLEEVILQSGNGITLPQNWMVWMVHRVWLNDPTITSLSFANMEIPEARLERNIGPKLMEALKNNTYVETLELQNTNLQVGESVSLLVEALKVNTTLKNLNLEGNQLDSAALVEIAESLKENSTLEVLKVQHQKTRSIGMLVEERFHDAMRVNTTLTKLGIVLQNAGHRDQIDRKLMQNSERKRHLRRAQSSALTSAQTPQV